MDREYFDLSETTRSEMKRMVGDADVVLMLLSPAAIASDGVRFEMQCALTREQGELRKILFAAKLRRCSPMRGWPADRLWANLHSEYNSEFRKLERSLLAASRKALPKPVQIQNSDGLYQVAIDTISASGFLFRGNIELLRRADEASDNPLAVHVVNVDGARNYSAFIATYNGWTIMFYIPAVTTTGRLREDLFSHERFGTRAQIGARLGSYLSHRREHPEAPKEHAPEELAKIFKRNKKVIDVILSPHSVGRGFSQRYDLQVLRWPSTRAALFYHPRHDAVGPMSLPVFIAPFLGKSENVVDALRCLKSVLRMGTIRAPGELGRWKFLMPSRFPRSRRLGVR